MASPLSNRRSTPDASAPSGPVPGSEPTWLALVAEKARSMQFGIIQIVVHDSRVVQVERTERTRFSVTGHPEAR